jgi:long-chain acyl-CoA synthetase
MTALSLALEEVRRRDRAHLDQPNPYRSLAALPDIWPLAVQRFGDTLALDDPHGQPAARLTYRELGQAIRTFAQGLQALGVGVGTHVALFADNSHRWLIADQGIMTAGAMNAVRSGAAETEELRYIAEHSESTVILLENLALLRRLEDRLADLPLSFGLLLSDQDPPQGPLPWYNFPQLMELGQSHPYSPVTLQPQDLATLIYTSGTTGKPKGVMLTHANLLHQVNTLQVVVQPQPGDQVVSILPSWHSFERTAEYFLLSRGCSQTYSSLRHLKADLKAVRPRYMVGVPRLWESIYDGAQKQFRDQPPAKQRLIFTCLDWSQAYVANLWRFQDLKLDQPQLAPWQRLTAGVAALALWPLHQLGRLLVYNKVRQATGGQVKQFISGGGSLARHLDVFFEIIGVPLLVGYGLTETAPVLSARRAWHNLRGAAGQPIPFTEIKIVDPESRQDLPQGVHGLVLARGPQVMAGYYRNPEATAQVIDRDGWFDTGDLGWLSKDGNVVLTGRAKDTIVLTNGENIEPQPLEDACIRSPYIDQIMLVGQDQRSLGALVVPNLEALQAWAAGQSRWLVLPGEEAEPPPGLTPLPLTDVAVETLIRGELTRQVKNRPGYRPDDRIGPFQLLSEPFSVENGLLTQTLKVRRAVVTERYRDMIEAMFT